MLEWIQSFSHSNSLNGVMLVSPLVASLLLFRCKPMLLLPFHCFLLQFDCFMLHSVLSVFYSMVCSSNHFFGSCSYSTSGRSLGLNSLTYKEERFTLSQSNATTSLNCSWSSCSLVLLICLLGFIWLINVTRLLSLCEILHILCGSSWLSNPLYLVLALFFCSLCSSSAWSSSS